MLAKRSSYCTILGSRVFHNFVLADEPFAKALRRLEFCALADKTLREKLLSSLESSVTFSDRFEVISVPLLFLILIC